DSFGPDEYLTSTDSLRVFRAVAPGHWSLVASSTQRGSDLYTFDLNRNGRPEVIVRGYPSTLILEYRQGTADSELGPRPWHRTAVVVPNPCRLEAVVQFAPTLDVVTFAIFDVAGHLVERRKVPDTRNQIVWSTEHLSQGIYLLRLEGKDGQLLAS